MRAGQTIETERSIAASKTAHVKGELASLRKYNDWDNPNPTLSQVLAQEGYRERAQQKLESDFVPLKDSGVELIDVENLYADLRYGGSWAEKSGPLLDLLLQNKLDHLIQKKKGVQVTDSFYTFWRQDIEKIERYFNLPKDKRWTKEGSEEIQRLAFDNLHIFKWECVIPLHHPKPKVPVALGTHGQPLRDLRVLEQSIKEKIYPQNPVYRDDRRGHDYVKFVETEEIREEGFVVDDYGLIEYPVTKSPSEDRIPHIVSLYSYHIADMANGVDASAKDSNHLANYGILLLTEAQWLKPQESLVNYLAAKKSFSLARELSHSLPQKDRRHLLQAIIYPEAEVSLRVALHQFFDRNVLDATERNLHDALRGFESVKEQLLNDQSVLTQRAWTLYHLGFFYQDLRRDPEKAAGYLTKALEAFLEFPQVAGGVSRIKYQLELIKGEITINTFGSKEKKIPFFEHLKALSLFDATMQEGVKKHYNSVGLQYITVPQIVGITGACENVDTLFGVRNRNQVPLFFTQTGQLSLEQAQQIHKGVWTVITSGRDEELEDARHLRQFKLTEEEFSSTMAGMTRESYDEGKMFDALLQHVERSTKSMIGEVVEKHGGILQKLYGRNLESLQDVLRHPYLRVTYEEALRLLNENGMQVKWGDDLKAEHEQAVVHLVNEKNRSSDRPVFITHYPKEIKFFNMKVSESDPRVVLSADLILPIAGEATGAAVREHDGEKLRKRLLESTMYRLHTQRGGTIADFEWYLDIIDKQRTDPHAGYGIGNERILQYILSQSDIRVCSLMSMLTRQSRDWELRSMTVAVPANAKV